MKKLSLFYNIAKRTCESLPCIILLHSALWALFIYLSLPDRVFAKGYDQNVRNYIVFYFLQIVFFYLNSLHWLPQVFSGKKMRIWRFLRVMCCQLVLLLAVILSLSWKYGNLSLTFTGWAEEWTMIPSNLGAFIRPYLLYWPLSAGYYYFTDNKWMTGENSRLKHELMLVKQRWLKAELDPHFINNCYHLLDGLLMIDRKKAEEALRIISSMMQYYLLKTKDGRIKMEDELRQCLALIELYTLRYGQIFVNLDFSAEELRPINFLPMSVALLLENMLRYGIFTDRNFPAKIRVRLNNRFMLISTINKIRTRQPLVAERTGRGLSNLKERLQHFYPGAHRLVTRQLNGYFISSLCIDLEAFHY